MLHLNMCSSNNVSKSYWFWCCDKQCILWGYKHEKFSDQLKNRELGNTRIPRSVEGHTSPLLARWHHSPFVGCHFGGDLEPQENTHETLSGKAQALRNCTWERNGDSSGWLTEYQTSCKLSPATKFICFKHILCWKWKECCLFYKCESPVNLVKRRQFCGDCRCWCHLTSHKNPDS